MRMKGRSWFDREGVQKAVEQATIEPLARCALSVERRAKLITSKGGRLEGAKGPKGGRGAIRSVPSAVGQPPHKQTGTLSNSITWAYAKSIKTGKRSAIIGPTTIAWYGAIHEHSTRFPRPFMRPALDHERPMFPRYFKNMKLSKTEAGQRLNRKKGKR